MKNKPPKVANISDLSPHLTEEQRRQMDDEFMAYLCLCVRIHEGITQDPVRHARFRAMVAKRKREREDLATGSNGSTIDVTRVQGTAFERVAATTMTTPQRQRAARQRRPAQAEQESPVVHEVTRQIGQWARLQLAVRAGGRCQFDGCNKLLLENPVTLTAGNFAEYAHIVAFSQEGPRGGVDRPADVNSIANLMLMCPQCHHEVDAVHPGRYPTATLRAFKGAHEDRIRLVTSTTARTSVLILRANIRGQCPAIPYDHVVQAVAPRYPVSQQGTLIDLTAMQTDTPQAIQVACETIAQRVRQLQQPGSELLGTQHLSILALGPIALLAWLGSQLSNKIPTHLYQRHRDTEDWTWKDDPEVAAYEFTRIREGTRPECVGLVVALSGTVPMEDLPREIDDRFSVYRITVTNREPAPTSLRSVADLHAFKVTYQEALRSLGRQHGVALQELHLFPAVPAPVAVLCGRELLPKVDPSILVYDCDRTRGGGFAYQLTVNTHD